MGGYSDSGADGARNGGLVAGEQDWAHVAPLQLSDGSRRLRPDAVGEGEGARERAVHAHVDSTARRRAIVLVVHTGGRGGSWRRRSSSPLFVCLIPSASPFSQDVIKLSDADPAPADDGARPCARLLSERFVLDRGHLRALGLGEAHHRLRKRVPRIGLDRGSERHELRTREWCRDCSCCRRCGDERNLVHPRFAERERARLIKHNRLHFVRLFEHVPAADEQPALGGEARPDEHGCGRGEPERARARHDEDARGELEAEEHGFAARDARHNLRKEARSERLPKPKGGCARAHDAVAKDAADAVREALHRRRAPLRLLHEPHDVRELRLVARLAHAHREAPLAVDGAGAHLVADALRHRERLARERRLVHRAQPAHHLAVHRHPVARQHRDEVARPQSPRRNRPRRRIICIVTTAAAANDEVGGARHEVEDLRHVARGLELGALLRCAPEQHKREEHHRLLEKRWPAQGGNAERHRAHREARESAEGDEGVHVWSPTPQALDAVDERVAAWPSERHDRQDGVRPRPAQRVQPMRHDKSRASREERREEVHGVADDARAREHPRRREPPPALAQPLEASLAPAGSLRQRRCRRAAHARLKTSLLDGRNQRARGVRGRRLVQRHHRCLRRQIDVC
mmetsp:Transcript_22231/g.72051  ORF Transcript_22231/g.72051 Transcript_22231/m.72051 type:complete len:633 (+) Transcript_22231:781-2679(+)